MADGATSSKRDLQVAVRNLAKLGGSLGTTLIIGFLIRPLLRRSMDAGAFGPLDAADGFTANAVACVSGATQVSQSCCSNGGSRVTCSAGGATCTRVEPGGGQPAFTCCSGRHQAPRSPNNSLCDGAVSQIQE